jgi:hypothetical protein
VVSGNEGLNCRMIGRLEGRSTYCSGYMRENLTTVDKMSTVVIEYF